MVDLIVYFVFSAVFAVGVRAYEQDEIPLQEFVMAVLLGWLLLPFGLGMVVGKIFNDKENE
jgi:ACR3 family arsenite efflux pump ArsB